MVLALATYQALERSDQTHAVAKFRSSAQIDREVENFKSQIQNLKSPDDLYKNRRLMNFVLSAYGLDSEINAMGRVKAQREQSVVGVFAYAPLAVDGLGRRIVEHAEQHGRIARVSAVEVVRVEPKAQRHAAHHRVRCPRRGTHEVEHCAA